MIRNVLLVYPAQRRYSGFLSTHRMPGMVLSHAGLTILAQVLRGRGIAVRVIDEQISPFHPALAEGADLVGISIQTCWAPQGYRIAALVRRMGVPVVLGGVHATLVPDEAIEHADYVVRGEGEHTLPELVAALDSGSPLEGIAGLTFKSDGRVHHGPPRPPLGTAELDRVPWPRLDLIEGFTDPWRFPVNRMLYFTMVTRGCNQVCSFCSVIRAFGGELRHRSVASVLEELGSQWDPSRQFLFFMDDSLAADKEFLKELLAALLRERLVPRLGWHSQMRADVARDPELLRLLRDTNCTFVTCGFESIDQGSLKELAKGQSPREIERAIARLREHGVVVNGFFMFGMDHDGPAAMAETVRFARRSGCALAGFMPLTPFPGTPTYQRLEEEGRILTRDWELYDVQHVVFRPQKMSPWELYWRTLCCYPAFYGRSYPGRYRELLASTRRPLGVTAMALAWPFVKYSCWAREVAANLDYARALRACSGSPGTPLPELDGHRLWWKDILSGRALARAVSTGRGVGRR